MRLASFRHKGLQRLYADDDVSGVPPAGGGQNSKLLFTLETASSLDQVRRFPGWRLQVERQAEGILEPDGYR